MIAKDYPGSIAVLAIAPRGMLLHAPDMYMNKIAVGPKAAGKIHLDAPIRDNLQVVAESLGRKVEALTVVIWTDRVMPASSRKYAMPVPVSS